tara:strand:- start:7234 stop:8115 length:882 start_codon:yes stop_codon:yes gene_type:complete
MILQNKKLEAIDPIDANKMVAEHGYLVIENSGASPEEFAKWNLAFGYHISPDIWCTDKEHSEYFWRVTNEKVDGENQGLFADDELDWHSNLVPHADAQEVIGLYGKTITYDTETWICTSIPYMRKLSATTKELYKSLYTKLNHSGGTPINQPWRPDWDKKYTDTVMNGIKQNRNKSRADLIDKRFKEWRGVLDKHKLVPNHPLGIEGIFFQPYEITEFVGLLNFSHKELYNEIYKDFITDNYTYKHKWKPGDILLMDQLTTIHRRPTIAKDQTRELLRSACWYKERNHFDYVL